MLFRGRPLPRFGLGSKVGSAVSASPSVIELPRLTMLLLFLAGVPARLVLVSDFRGRPRRLMGEESSPPFSGTVVVLLLVFLLGVPAFSSAGSASTVTLIFQGLTPGAPPVFMMKDLEGELFSLRVFLFMGVGVGEFASGSGESMVSSRWLMLRKLRRRGARRP